VTSVALLIVLGIVLWLLFGAVGLALLVPAALVLVVSPSVSL